MRGYSGKIGTSARCGGSAAGSGGATADELIVAGRILRALVWLAALAVLLVLSAVRCADAVTTKVQVKPYIEVTHQPSEIQFNSSTGPGMRDAAMSMTVKVDTNANFGGLILDATVLTLVEPKFPPDEPPPPNTPPYTVPTSRLYVKATGMSSYVAMAQPVAVMGPKGPGHYEVTLWFRLDVIVDDLPGRYHGTCNLTVLPAAP